MPCGCVLRRIFRSCYAKFRYCSSKEKHIGKVRLEPVTGSEWNYCWGMKEEEYIADFCIVSRRSLEPGEYELFRFHFLLGADWKLCCRRLNIDRGLFFHKIYAIEEKLGRVFRELRPYALFPLDEYFGGTVRASVSQSQMNLRRMPGREGGSPLRAPLKKVA